MKNIVVCGVVWILGTVAFSQIQGDGGMPISSQFSVAYSPTKVVFQQPDIKKLRAEDELNDAKGEGPWRFGFNNIVDLNMDNSGDWTNLANGGKIWTIQLECLNALTVNLTLENVVIPEGNELFVYNEDKSFVLGKFTAYHTYKGRLGTELVPGSSAIVEYYVAPENTAADHSLTIQKVTHGYRTGDEFQAKAFGSSGACNMNVNCPDGLPWEQQKRSAVMLVNSGGNGFCSGAIVNNTLNDGKPYVLTANHCYSDPTTWVFRFNWEAAGCTNPGTSPAFNSLSGSVLRARRTLTDFCLVEITGGLIGGTIPASYNAYFSGWDNSGVNPTSMVSIHHPKGDIKKISFNDEPSYPVQSTIGGVQSEVEGSWEVEWDRGTTTESASSGSPLFDQNHRIIGQLWGGGASCLSLDANDYYGRFSKSWEPTASTSVNQLKFWLDPTNIGAVMIDGYDPAVGATTLLDATIAVPQGITETYCIEDVTPQVTLINLGSNPLTSATISYGFDGAQNLTFNWTGSIPQYGTEIVTLPSATMTGGAHTFIASTTNPNGGLDENTQNDTIQTSFYTVINGEDVTLNLTLDCYASETSWTLASPSGTILYSSPGYSNNTEGLVTYNFCLADSCYIFTLNDQYGDGMSGCASGDGSYEILNESMEVVANLLEADADFGLNYVQPVCIGTSGIETLSKEALFTAFPNPTNGTMTVQADKIMTEIQLTSLTGEHVLQTSAHSKNLTIDLSALSQGVYLLQVQTEDGLSVMRVVKE